MNDGVGFNAPSFSRKEIKPKLSLATTDIPDDNYRKENKTKLNTQWFIINLD